MNQRLDRRQLFLTMSTAAGVALVPGWSGAQATPVASPVASVPIPDDIVAAMRAAIEDTMATEGIPGAVVHFGLPGYLPFQEAFGVADKTTGQPVTLETHFRIGSITKTFVGMVILQLVDEGALSLDDTIDTWGFTVPNADLITVRHLLSMSSGLVNYTETHTFITFLATDPSADISLEEIVALANEEPLFAPGDAYYYSNTNYILLGLIAEQVTGQELPAVLEERVFGPFGLGQTGFDVTMPEPFARGYGDVDPNIPPEVEAQLAATPVTMPVATPVADVPVDDDGQFDTTSFNPGWAWAAGEAWSTVGDMAVWLPALVAGESLSPDLATQRLEWVPVDPDHPEYGGYGLGIADLGGLIGHNGAVPGYSSLAVLEPETGFSIVVLTNLYPGSELLMTPDTQLANATITAALPILAP